MTPSPALLLLSSSPLSHPRSTLTRRRRRPAFRHYENGNTGKWKDLQQHQRRHRVNFTIFAMIISSPMKKGGLGAEVDLCYRRRNTLSSLSGNVLPSSPLLPLTCMLREQKAHAHAHAHTSNSLPPVLHKDEGGEENVEGDRTSQKIQSSGIDSNNGINKQSRSFSWSPNIRSLSVSILDIITLG